MNLPNYFLADVSSEASLSAEMVREACQTLRRNRDQYLASRSTDALIEVLVDSAQEWLRPEYRFRRLALEANVGQVGFSPPTLAAGLDAFFRQITPENLRALLVQELGHESRLDAFCSSPAEHKQQRQGFVRGPELLVHIAAGNIPTPAFLSIILGLLIRSAQFLKCASGAAFLPRLFAHSLYEAEPKLGACLELAEWEGGQPFLEEVLFREADCVTVAGSDETLNEVRHRLPARVRLVGYGHRVSFAYIARERLIRLELKDLVESAAADVVAWNQLGCLSPHVLYVETGGRVSPEEFAQRFAEQLAALEEVHPRGTIPVEAAAAIASRRAFYEVRAAHSPDTRQWCSGGSTAWTVVYENDARFQLSCLHRFVYIKAVSDPAQALEGADSIRDRTSTVGLAAAGSRAGELALAFAKWGASRVCPLGVMQRPPLSWRHDGRPALADLITWTDWEREG